MNTNVEVNIPSISKELTQSSTTSLDKKSIKACLFTLVIYAQNARVASHLQDLVESIIEKFPCRLIFICLNSESKKSFINVKVENITSGNISSGALLSCDQITINASSDQAYRVPLLIIPHIVTDLPLYLLWGQNPFDEKEIFPSLKPYASRVIFDSECSTHLEDFCNEMIQNSSSLKMEIMDVNWAFVSNWRDIIVQVFDTPQKALSLNGCKKITITYNDKKNSLYLQPEIRSLYLQGWLAACLGWKYRLTEKFYDDLIISYYSASNPIVVGLTSTQQDDIPCGAIISIEIVMTNGDTYHLKRKSRLGQVTVQISSKLQCEMPFILELPNVHRGITFMREIFFNKIGDQYLEMLKMISNIKILSGNESV